jgi:hypothetical protein
MVDQTTPIFAFLLQETGGNNNSWGTNLNNSVITPIENAIAGCLTIGSLTGGAYPLTQANALYGTIILQGTLASDLVITAPSTANNWRFINELDTAGFYVLIKTSGNTAVNIPHGKLTEITCDGTDMHRHDRENVGELFYHSGTTAPGGALECTGATPIRLSAVDLFGEIGTTWGVGNGATTFTIPDGYTAGKFLRSRTASVAIATSQTSQNLAHTHTGSGTTSVQSADHTHTYSGNTGTQSANHTHSTSGIPLVAGNNNNNGGGGGSFAAMASSTASYVSGSESANHSHACSGTTTGISASHTHTYSFTTSSDGGSEARPTNLSAMLCIRY